MRLDPFSEAHRAAERKATKDAAAQEISARDTRIADADYKRSKPKVAKSYIPAGPFWGPK